MLEEITYFLIFGRPLIFYIGVFTLLFLLVTASIPLLNRRKILRVRLKWHTRIATVSLAFAIIHGALVVLAYL